LDFAPSKVKLTLQDLTTNADDQIGIYRITLNEVEILIDPNGEAGTAYADNQYWLDAKALDYTVTMYIVDANVLGEFGDASTSYG